MTTNQSTYILYHFPCQDGFGAAFAAWLKFGDSATYLPCSYGKDLPVIPDGSEVYMIDISYPREVMLSLSKRMSKFVVLEHHVTAQKELEGLEFAIFDMSKSGAGLAWDYFHPNTERHWLINCIEDRDLWTFKLKSTREVTAALSSYPFDFKTWENLMKNEQDLILQGEAVLRLILRTSKEAVSEARFITIAGYESIPTVNAISFISDVCEELSLAYPQAPFVACYFDSADGKRKWSLRSKTGKADVEVIAKSFGGGGHKTASGFRESYPGEHISCKSTQALFKNGSNS